MVVTWEIFFSVVGILVAQGATFTIYAVRAAKAVGAASQRLTSIDDHLERANGRLDKTDERLRLLEISPTWTVMASDMAKRIEYVGRQNQAMLQDLNERRSRENLPPITVQPFNGVA